MTRFLRRTPPRADDVDKRRLLAANELFKDLSEDVLAEVEQMTNLSTARAGQILIQRHGSGEVLFFLKKGHVQIYRLTADGKKLIVHDVKPGEFFGEMAALGQGMVDSIAEATQDSLICAMSRVDVYRLLQRRPEIAQRVIEHLAGRLHEAEARLETLAYQRLEARLASVLLRECAEDEDAVLGLSQQDLAEMVGASRESVTRSLKQLADSGALSVERRKIVLRDPTALQRVIRPDGD